MVLSLEMYAHISQGANKIPLLSSSYTLSRQNWETAPILDVTLYAIILWVI